WGKSVHAIVQPCDPENPPTVEELTRHCRERLAPYKVPKSWELVEQLPRDEAGKVRRSALAAEGATSSGNGHAAAPAGTTSPTATTAPTPTAPAAASQAAPSEEAAPPDEKRSRRRRQQVLGVVALVALVGVVLGGLALLGRDDGDSGPRLPGLASDGGGPSADPRTAGMDLSGEPARGPRGAEIVIVEFTDYQCEFCLRFHKETFRELLQAYPGRLRYVVRHFPLTDVHPFARTAAEAAECAHQQGRFWEYHDRLFASEGRLALEDLRQAARDADLDAKKFDSCLESGAAADEVNADTLAGQSLGVRGTPTFFVNGRMTEGAKPLDHFRTEIEQATAAAQ
ncbi:MAG TPA: thioredoxin domain-containing protein, partial [Acidimicrobiales bacterium]|nr:thioredoxin domain-containing protein [Acidimicrobiales bacterium]